MTPRPPQRHAAVLPLPTELSLHAGRLRTAWCDVCRAWTHLTADLLLLAPEGVSTIGTWSWCEICDDPDDPLPARRTDRAGP